MFMGGITADLGAGPAPLAIDVPVADWILPKSEVEQWLERATPGSRLLYGQGEQLVRGATSKMLRTAADLHEVHLFAPRSALPGRFDFIAVKRLVERPKRAGGRVSDPAMRVIFKRLVSAAKRNERAPSDRMLAALAGLSTFSKAQWRIRKLERAGMIRCRLEPCLADPMFRVIAILDKDGETIAETAGPPDLCGALHSRQPGARR